MHLFNSIIGVRMNMRINVGNDLNTRITHANARRVFFF